MVKWEKIDNNKVKMEIEVPENEVEKALDRAYLKVVKEVNLPGFRKGKVPRKILESRFGSEVLYKDSVDYMLPEAYRKALDDEKIEPIDEPEIDIVQIEKGKPFIFTALVEVKPEVKLGEYQGVVVESEEEDIDDERVEEHIKGLREQHARLIEVEEQETKVAEGDLVLIDFCGYVDGEVFEGGEAKDYSLEIGSNTFIPGFEEQLIGLTVNEEKEVKVTFPEDYRNENLNGKDVVFNVTLKQIKRKELPDLNDDFATEISEFDSLDAFKEDISKKLKEDAQNKSKAELENTLIEKISSDSEVEIPDVLVEKQLNNILSELDQYMRYQGLNLEKFLEISQKSMDDLREENREEAIKRVKANLVLDAIIKKEGIEATEQELDEKIKEIADHYKDSAERIKDVFSKQGRTNLIMEEIRMRKVIDFLVEKAEVKVNKKVKAEKSA